MLCHFVGSPLLIWPSWHLARRAERNEASSARVSHLETRAEGVWIFTITLLPSFYSTKTLFLEKTAFSVQIHQHNLGLLVLVLRSISYPYHIHIKYCSPI